jgi:hypothetical protein
MCTFKFVAKESREYLKNKKYMSKQRSSNIFSKGMRNKQIRLLTDPTIGDYRQSKNRLK